MATFNIRQVDPGVRANEAMLGLGDDQFAATPQNPDRLLFDQWFVGQRVVGVDIDESSLRFRHDLLRDDKTVAIVEIGVVGGGD